MLAWVVLAAAAPAHADPVTVGNLPEKINAEGHGEAGPVEPNQKHDEDNPEGRAKNRRVEIAYAP